MYQHYGDILTISVNDWMAAGLIFEKILNIPDSV